MIKTLALVVSGFLALSFASSGSFASSARATTLSGTAVANQRQGSGALISLRTSKGSLSRLILGKSTRVTTADGYALEPADVRVGDHLTVTGGTRVQDTSQRLQSMRGIISFAPLDNGEPIVLQITPLLMIAVDTGSGIRYTDRSRETSSLIQLQDSDILQIHGVYDSAMGEMTRTDAIARLGPSRHKKHTTRKK